jgi:hypothetical protein
MGDLKGGPTVRDMSFFIVNVKVKDVRFFDHDTLLSE